MKSQKPKFKYVFLWIDIIVFTLAFFWALHKAIPDFFYELSNNYYFGFNHITFYFLVLAIYLFSFRYNSLYMRNVLANRYRHLFVLIKAMIAAGVFWVLLMLVFNIDYLTNYGKTQVLYFSVSSFVLFFIIRALFGKYILKYLLSHQRYEQKILIIGGDGAAKHAAGALLKDSFKKFNVVGFLDDYKDVGVEIYKGFHNLGKLDDLMDIILKNDINEILIAIDHAPYIRLIHIVEECLKVGQPVRIYSDLLNVVAEKMRVEYYSDIPVVVLSQNPVTGPAWSDKRTFDILLSSLALIILSPLFFLVSIGIKMSSKGPVIFKQVRIGKNGQPFNFYKFRSMHVGTDNSRHKEYVTHLIKDKDNCESKDIKLFKIKDDPRIFKLGKFIRKTSIDEFPQFYNVLKGDMALVGPRPCLPYEWDCYDEWHKNRLNVVPGCTGLWQALGRSTVNFEEMVILDLYYISNTSLWFDFRIVMQTFPVIFLGKGGY